MHDEVQITGNEPEMRSVTAVDEPLDASLGEPPPDTVLSSVARSNPVRWLRLAYAIEFLFVLEVAFTMWSEVGGQGHLDLLPWYTKLFCVLALAWCAVRFTAAAVENDRLWTRRTVGWFSAMLLIAVTMGGITYYYHLHEEPDEPDTDENTAAVVVYPAAQQL